MRRTGAAAPSPHRALDRLNDDDDHQKADARDEPGMQVRPQEEQWGQQPETPATGAQIRLGDPERPADQREREDLRPRSEDGLGRTRGDRQSHGEDNGPGAAKAAAQQRREHRAPRDQSHQHGHQEEAADCGESGEDGLRQPFVRDQWIAECGVGEELAGGDLVVGDDPIPEANVPPDIGVAQRVETDAAGEHENRCQQGPTRIRQPGIHPAAPVGRLWCRCRFDGADQGCHSSAA